MSKENKVYFCGGVNGVGKSSFLQALIQNYPEFEIFSGSKNFLEWLCLKPNDYESLRRLNYRYKNDELDKMMNRLLKKGDIRTKSS